MGEENVELIEKMLENTVDDVKELKSEYKDLKREVEGIHRKQSVTDNTVQQFSLMFTNLEQQIRELREDWKKDKEEERKRRQEREENDRKERNRALWTIGTTVIIAMILIQLGIK